MIMTPIYYFELAGDITYMHVVVRDAEGNNASDVAVIGMPTINFDPDAGRTKAYVERLVVAVADILFPGVIFSDVRHHIDASIH